MFDLRPAAVTASLCLLLTSCGSSSSPDLLPGEIVAASRPADVSGPETPGPRETEHVLEEDAEESNREARERWFEERHRAAPDVDWRAVEKTNADRQRRKRNGLSTFAAATASRWTERGSDNVAGRMHVTARATDGVHLYAGSSRGGLWRGTLDGQDWEPLADHLFGGVHWLAVVPGATPGGPDALVVTTDGGAIHVSHDHGTTWLVPSGLPATVGVRRALVRPGTNTIFLMVQWWQSGQLRNGLYRSTDRGLSFAKTTGMQTYRGDVWTPRDAPGPMYLLKNDEIQISTDDGATWSTVGTTGVSSSGGELTGSEAGAPRLYAILDAGGTKLYRSDDAGGSFTYMHDVSDYWGSLSASIVDADLFAWGGVEVHRTTNGGSSFAVVNNWWEYYGQEATKLHADVPGIDVVPDAGGGETWYVSTDGGLFESDDGLASVQNLSLEGLRVSQYYGTHTSTANPDHVLAGSQDQGYQRADLPAADALDFDQLISGDYAHLTSGDGSHQWVYSVYPGFVLVQKGENNPQLFQVDFPANQSMGWLPMVKADPDDNERWFLCASKLWRYRKQGLLPLSWTMVEWSTFDFSGGGGNYMSAIDFSPLDSQRAYAATNDGRLYHSSDKGKTWTPSTTDGPDAHYFHGTALVASAHDVDTVYVGGSGYGSTPAVWRSTDGGVTFSPWASGLPPTLVYDLAESPDGSALFAGTETAAYMRDVASGTWIDITQDDAPVTTYWSVEAVEAANVMRFGTYGRGIWDYALDEPCVYEAYGLAAGGANVITLDSASSSVVGGLHVLDVAGGPAGAQAVLLASTGTASLPLLGGTLLVNPADMFQLPIPLDGSGALTLPLPIPDDAILYDLGVAFQVAAPDPGQAKGWAFSNGLSTTFCAP